MHEPLNDAECRAKAEQLAGKATIRKFLQTTPRTTSGRQLLELVEYADTRGYTLHANQHRYYCSIILDNPRHVCTSARCPVYLEDVDHPVVLRRKDKTGWAILSQEYATPDVVAELGLAPYGNGTAARLIVGKRRD